MARPATRDHLLSRKKPVRRTVTVVLDPELAELYETSKARTNILAARLVATPDLTDLADEYVAAESELTSLRQKISETDAVVDVTFAAIGRSAYDALISAHPPTPAQEEEAKAAGHAPTGLLWNPDTFPPAIVAASMVSPKLTLDDVTSLFASDSWNQAEQDVLVATAVEVNTVRRLLDTAALGKDSGATRPSAPKSATASNGESPIPSS